jgi:hypothetical protein
LGWRFFVSRIREDLVGVVWAGGVDLFPGDEVPAGVSVGDDLLATETPVEKAEPKPVVKRRAVPVKSEE